jgi:hypothetical protein
MLGKRIKDIVSEVMDSESDHELNFTIDKLNAVLDNNFLEFHRITEQELQRKDEAIENELAANVHLQNGLQRLRTKNNENIRSIIDLTRQIHDIMENEPAHHNKASEVAFSMPYEDVKRYLTYLDYYPDSIVDPEQNMNEFMWRQVLYNYMNVLGHLPIQAGSSH